MFTDMFGMHRILPDRFTNSGGGGVTSSDWPSDRATDHCPMLFVHSRMVRHRSDGPSLCSEAPPSFLLYELEVKGKMCC